MQAEKGSSTLARQVVVTIVVLALAALARRVPAPGLALQEVRGHGGGLAGASIGLLGLVPWIVGWFLVEVFSLLPGPGRRLRRSGWKGRQALDRASMVLGLAACLIQAMAASQVMESFLAASPLVQLEHPGWWFRIPYVLTLTATSCALYWLGTAINRWGIGHGFGLLLLLELALQLGRMLRPNPPGSTSPLLLEPNQILAQFLGALAFSAAFILYLRWTEGGGVQAPGGAGEEAEGGDEPEETAPRPPRWAVAFPQGVLPVLATGWLLALLFGGGSWQGLLGARPFAARLLQQGPWFWVASQSVLVVLFAWLFDRLFSGPRRLAAELPVDPETLARHGAELRRRFWIATGLLLAGSAGLVAWSVFNPGPWATFVDILRLSLVVSVCWDLASQWRFTLAQGPTATLCSLNNVHLAPELVARLERAGIPATLRGFRHRALFFAYLPLVQVGVLVPERRLEEAQKLLAEMDLKAV